MDPRFPITRREWLKRTAASAAALPLAGHLAVSRSAVAADRQGASADLDPTVFLDPGLAYRGVTLWMLNDKLEIDEAIRQLRGFRDAGWGAVITRTFMGIRTPYLSAQWLALTDRVVEVSRELGTRVFLQHADKNAAGYMATGIPGMEERFRHKLLVRVPAADPSPARSELLARSGQYAYYQQTVVPPGDWAQLMAVLDLLDEETVAAYLKKAYDPLADRYGKEFGKTVEAIWVDEPWLRIAQYSTFPSLPWTPRLAELFRQEWGYPLLDHLPSLFAEVGDHARIRCHYWRTVLRQYEKAYWKPVGDWCQRHQVRFAGHQMGEDTLYSQIAWTGGIMPCYEHMQTPGIDHLTKSMNWPTGAKFILTPKQCSSAAHQLGRNEVLCEVYGVSDQGLTFEDRKFIAQWVAVLGINYRCYHGSFYSMRGRRKRFYAPHLSHQQPWWPENRRVADPMARLSYALCQGDYQADILVVHSLESAQSVFSPLKPGPEMKSLEKSLVSLSENLLALHRSFDYGDELLMARHGKVEGGRLCVGKMSYRLVVLPSLITLRKSTIELLSSLLDAGGSVISVGQLPSRIDGAEDAGIARFLARVVTVMSAQDLGRFLHAVLPPGVELAGGADRIWVHERLAGRKRILFLAQTDRRDAVDAELRVRGAGRLEAWNLVTGRAEPVPQWRSGPFVVAPLRFEPGGSHLLVFHEGEPFVPLSPARTSVTRTIEFAPPYAMKRHDPNALTLDFCRYRCGSGPWSDRIPVIGVLEKLTGQKYNGPVELEYRFEAEELPGSCSLVVEDSEACRVEFNGARVQRTGNEFYRDRGFHRLDVSGRVRPDNVAVIARHFVAADANAIRDPERLYGTDLESIHVIGEFAVRRRSPSSFALGGPPSLAGPDLLAEGYPFYAGKITLARDVDLPGPAPQERVFLDLGSLDAVLAVIRVNGQEAGAATWAPYRVELTRRVKAGKNRIEVELTNSLRNLLGPHHYRGPRKQEVWETSYTARGEHVEWMDAPRRHRLKTWSDAYEFVPFGLGSVSGTAPRIVYEGQE